VFRDLPLGTLRVDRIVEDDLPEVLVAVEVALGQVNSQGAALGAGPWGEMRRPFMLMSSVLLDRMVRSRVLTVVSARKSTRRNSLRSAASSFIVLVLSGPLPVSVRAPGNSIPGVFPIRQYGPEPVFRRGGSVPHVHGSV
jgi:hypothetical protein